MAAEGIRVQSAPTVSESFKLSGRENKRETARDSSKETHGDGDTNGVAQAQPTESTQPVGAIKGSEVPKSAEESKPTEDNKPAGEDSETTAKREHDSTSAPGIAEKSTHDEISEPTAKKQKTDVNGGHAAGSATNGEKKVGRPKKIKDAIKKVIPTDGIGSRTRSRTKASS